MTNYVSRGFTALDSNLNLDPELRKHAQLRHNDIRDALTNAGVISGSFLQGSFARATATAPLKDIDVVCLLPEDARNELYTPEGPGRAMESFKDPVRRLLPSVQFDAPPEEPKGKALRLSFDDCDYTIDLVPGFEAEDGWFEIGDRFKRTWKLSNSRIQIRKVAARNSETGKRFVHQVREFKHLVKQDARLEFVTGIVIESLMYGAVTRRLSDSEALTAALEHAATAASGPIIEPAGDDDVTESWTAQQRRTATLVFGELAVRAREALELERAGDTRAAASVWHQLIGEQFPAPPPASVLDTVRDLRAGSIASSGAVSATTVGRQPVRPSRAWSASAEKAPPTWFRS